MRGVARELHEDIPRLTHAIELASELPPPRVALGLMPIRVHLACPTPERIADLGDAGVSRHTEGFPGLVERHEASTRYR